MSSPKMIWIRSKHVGAFLSVLKQYLIVNKSELVGYGIQRTTIGSDVPFYDWPQHEDVNINLKQIL